MLRKRQQIVEDLDNFEFQGDDLLKTLEGLSKVNRFFGSKQQTLKSVRRVANRQEVKSIVDLACGGGDNLEGLAKWFQKEGKKIQLIGVDGSKHVLEYTKEKIPFEIEYIQADILNNSFEVPKCDVLISSHFMYHFEDDQLVTFLQNSKSKISKSIIFSELERSAIAYYLFTFVGLFFGRTVKKDGLTAIRRAFRKKELEEIIQKAGFEKYTIRRTFWFRLLATIDLT